MMILHDIILKALEAVNRVKEAIQFHDDEALQQALDKVKERPLIGKYSMQQLRGKYA